MTEPDVNPYSPPSIACALPNKRRSTGSLAISLASGIVAFAFIGFTIVLLRSGPSVDRTAGTMFLVNVPVLIGLVIASNRSRRGAAWFAAGAACVQLSIMFGMLLMNVGDTPIVVGVNFAIAVVFLVIAIWAWRSHYRSETPDLATVDSS